MGPFWSTFLLPLIVRDEVFGVTEYVKQGLIFKTREREENNMYKSVEGFSGV